MYPVFLDNIFSMTVLTVYKLAKHSNMLKIPNSKYPIIIRKEQIRL